MSGGSTFDKYIKLNWQMVLMDVVLGSMGAFAAISSVDFMGAASLALLILPIAALINAARKLFFKSLYGSEAVTYQSLPVSTEEMVIAKVSVMTGISLLVITALMTAYLFKALYVNDDSFAEFVAVLTGQEYLDEFHIPYIVAAEMAGTITVFFRMWIVIFAAVVWYNSMPDGQKNSLLKLLAGAGALVLECAAGLPAVIMTRMSGESYWLPAQAVAIVMNIIVAAVLYKYIVRRVSKHYELS